MNDEMKTSIVFNNISADVVYFLTIRGIMVFRFPYCYYVYKQPFKLNIKMGSISMVW